MSDVVKKRVRGGGREARRELRSANKSKISITSITSDVIVQFYV